MKQRVLGVMPHPMNDEQLLVLLACGHTVPLPEEQLRPRDTEYCWECRRERRDAAPSPRSPRWGPSVKPKGADGPPAV